MPLPEAIKVRPWTVPVHADLDFKALCPGSKSLTNRSLVLAALGKGPTELRGALWSEDTILMTECLKKLGFQVEVKDDPSNSCNRRIIIQGQGGKIPVEKADLFVGAAGTVARFMTAFCALGKGPYRLSGTPRMHERPMKELFDAMVSLGGKVRHAQGHLPATLEGPIRRNAKIMVSGAESSQFASALLLVGMDVECDLPYVDMTRALLQEWETPSKVREIEFDASNAGYFLALYYLLSERFGILSGQETASSPAMKGWLKNSSQLDSLMSRFWPLEPEISRKKDLGDAVMTYVIMAAAQKKPLRLFEAGNLRHQECDRILALKTELNRCAERKDGGPPADDPSEDELVLQPIEKFKKAVIQTYNDHRIAMCFSVLGAALDAMGDGSPWLTIKNPSCVEKTFPNFFETMEKVAEQSYEAAGKPYSPVILTVDEKPLF